LALAPKALTVAANRPYCGLIKSFIYNKTYTPIISEERQCLFPCYSHFRLVYIKTSTADDYEFTRPCKTKIVYTVPGKSNPLNVIE